MKLRQILVSHAELLKPVVDLQTQNKPQEAIGALDKLIGEHPEFAGKTGFFRFRLLLFDDEPAANTQARKPLEGDLNKAVETCELAAKLAEADSSLPQGTKLYIQGRLKAYKAAQQQAARPAATTVN